MSEAIEESLNGTEGEVTEEAVAVIVLATASPGFLGRINVRGIYVCGVGCFAARRRRQQYQNNPPIRQRASTPIMGLIMTPMLTEERVDDGLSVK